MTRDELVKYAETLENTTSDCPFDEDFDSVVLRHSDTKKWFGLLMKLPDGDAVNLKAEPMNSDFLRSAYKGVVPAYHMNKVHWNTVYLTSDVPDDEIKLMTEQSYKLTMKGKANGRKNRT